MGKINVYNKIMIENQKKGEKIWKSKKFVHKSPSNRWFRNGIHSLLSWANARRSTDIIYRVWRISQVCRSDSYWCQKV